MDDNARKYFIYTLLDAARLSDEMSTAQQLQTDFVSLYTGQSEAVLSSVAPYLFSCPKASGFEKWLLENGWGNSWGVYLETSANIEDVRKHFRKFLLVKTEDNTELYFRFYDPRVLRIFLPTCDVQQLKDFFGPIEKYICEDEDPAFALVYSFDGRRLLTQRVDANAVLNTTNDNSTVISQVPIKNSLKKDNTINPPESKSKRRFFLD